MSPSRFYDRSRQDEDNYYDDFYETPEWATEELLKRVEFKGNILEPCSGAGAISKVLERNNYIVISSDIRTDEHVYGKKGIDMFVIDNNFDNIVTNPPYTIAKEVIEKSLDIAKFKVAMLLKLTFLDSVKRYNFFKTTPLESIYVFSNRLTMYPYGYTGERNTGAVSYAWFIWNKDYIGKPTVDWIKRGE